MRIASRHFGLVLLVLTVAPPLFQLLPHLTTQIRCGVVSSVCSVSGFLKKKKISNVFLLHTARSFWCLWGMFSSVSGKRLWAVNLKSSRSGRRPMFSGAASPSWVARLVARCLGPGLRVRGCPTAEGCCFCCSCLSAWWGEQRIGCYGAARWAGYGVFAQISFDSRELRIFFPRYLLLSMPPCYLVLASGKYLPYESTCDT